MANRLSIDDPRRRPFRPQGGGFVTRAQADFGGGAGAIGGRTRQLLSGGGIHETRGIPSEPGDVFRPDGGAMQRKIGVMMPTQPGGGAPGSTRAALLGGGGDLREQALAGSQIALTKLTGLKPGQKSARERALAQLRSPQLTNDERTERGRLHQIELAKIPGQAALKRQGLADTAAEERLGKSIAAVDERSAAERASREKMAEQAQANRLALENVRSGRATDKERATVANNLRNRQTRLLQLKNSVPQDDPGTVDLINQMFAETSIDLGIAEGGLDAASVVGDQETSTAASDAPAGGNDTGMVDFDGKPGISQVDRDYNALTAAKQQLDPNDPNNAAKLKRINAGLAKLGKQMGV